jgi:Spy/CpxP family protein refolding chaperone
MVKAGVITTFVLACTGVLGWSQTQTPQPVVRTKQSVPAAAPADGLTDTQQTAIADIRSETQQKAAPVAATLAATVKESYENMLSDQSDPALQEKLCRQAAESLAQLITIANQGMQKGVAVLTPEQRQRVRSEMGKPGAPGDLLDLIAKVYGQPGK